MGRKVYSPTLMVLMIFVGFYAGKYTLRPMDPSWDRVPQRPSSPPPVRLSNRWPKKPVIHRFLWLTPKKWPNDLGNWGNKTLLVRGCWFTPFITVFWAHLVGDRPECGVDDISGNHDVAVISFQAYNLACISYRNRKTSACPNFAKVCAPPNPTCKDLLRQTLENAKEQSRKAEEERDLEWNPWRGHAGFVVACGNQMIEFLVLVCNMHLPKLVKHCHIFGWKDRQHWRSN